MGSLRILNSRKVKDIMKLLETQWGFTKKLDYVFMMSEKGRIHVIHRDLEQVIHDLRRSDTIGMYFGEVKEGVLRLSIEGSQIVGPHATHHVITVTDLEVEAWLTGRDLEKVCEEHGFVILKHRNDFVGCGRVGKGKVWNFIPKNRRIHELNPDSMGDFNE